MDIVLTMFCIQGVVGAFDNLWHHQLTERLHTRPAARTELTLHTVREFLYGIIFLGLAWLTWSGAWAVVLAVLLAIEVVVTMWDFIEEDRSRPLPPFERALHTVLAINFGALLAIFAPVWLDWVSAPTDLTPAQHGVLSWLMTGIGVGVLGWAVYDVRVVYRLSVPDWRRHPIAVGQCESPRHVLVTGGTGFIGRALVRALLARGDRPVVYSRSAAKAAYCFGRHADVVTDLHRIAPDTVFDAVVNLAGEPILAWPWTAKRRQVLLDSRVGTTDALVALFRRLSHPPDVLVTGSAVGYYGNHDGETLTEYDGPQDIFVSELCRRWEAAAKAATPLGIRVCCLRIGLVLGRDGGALPQFLRSVGLGLGAIVGSGRQWMSWIHKQDLVRLILFAIDQPMMSGPVNATSPDPVTNAQFMRALGRRLRRPVFWRVPAVVLRTAMGEMADLLVAGQKVVPSFATALGFRFEFADIDAALSDLTVRRDVVPNGREVWPAAGTRLSSRPSVAGDSGSRAVHRNSSGQQAEAP